ncbi:hypothetical protein NNJEOMEG_02554 [Fundidesulfovibrio magnetotacticus]|uniref:Uncharacterized protein n=1 Tax=Fundidesulfovibrio magnetotacticus TaxID=2730080 RepID=A0A6V8LYI2_9BACT|nr:hypothetical protein [Fundidesulfovibrio magnetotacticus]GFK94707.1 hypothetical protein NNJEOMEG_02554 [Fundidesulfovibrio magnetotacticus]
MLHRRPVPAALLALLLFALALPAFAAQKTPKPKEQAAPDPNAQSLAEFFKDEAVTAPKALDFKIEAGYADIRAETPEASGRYFLAGQALAGVAPDIYRLDLTFKHKLQRDIIDLAPEYFFTQVKTYYFWYNGGNKIVFKLGNGKKAFPISKKELTEIKVKSLETYTIEKTKLPMDLVIQDGNTRIYLQIKFI